MTANDKKFWPYRPRTSFVWAVVIFLGLLLIQAITRFIISWPGSDSETVVLIGIAVFSLLPILLAMIDVLIERGGAIELQGIKIDFAKPTVPGIPGMTVPVNFGLSGQPVTDSSTTEILESLRQATGCEAVIIDLADGQAWWETRLLVLLAGAVRIGKPEKAVFLATDGRAHCQFQGWAHPRDLLLPLLNSHLQYQLSYHTVLAASRQWSLVEPVGPKVFPANPPWMTDGVALKHSWMAFDPSGLPNTLYPEQLLASELGDRIESQEQVRRVTLVRMEELFRPILHRESIDETWPDDRQLKSFFEGDASYLAITRNGEFIRLVSRLTILNSMMEKLVMPNEILRQ